MVNCLLGNQWKNTAIPGVQCWEAVLVAILSPFSRIGHHRTWRSSLGRPFFRQEILLRVFQLTSLWQLCTWFSPHLWSAKKKKGYVRGTFKKQVLDIDSAQPRHLWKQRSSGYRCAWRTLQRMHVQAPVSQIWAKDLVQSLHSPLVSMASNPRARATRRSWQRGGSAYRLCSPGDTSWKPSPENELVNVGMDQNPNSLVT